MLSVANAAVVQFRRTFVKKSGTQFTIHAQIWLNCLATAMLNLTTLKICAMHHQKLSKPKKKNCSTFSRMFRSLFRHHLRTNKLKRGLLVNYRRKTHCLFLRKARNSLFHTPLRVKTKQLMKLDALVYSTMDMVDTARMVKSLTTQFMVLWCKIQHTLNSKR